MKSLIATFLLGTSLFAGNAIASPIFYQADDVSGGGTILYGNGAPTFSFTGSGDVTHNLGDYVPGDYTISFLLEGLKIDINEDQTYEFTQLSSFSFTSAPVSLPILSLSGNNGLFDWGFNPSSGGYFTYDFDSILDPSGYTNIQANGLLAYYDGLYSGSAANGKMTADISWDRLRIELNAVPEPSILFLLGGGLLAFGVQRKSYAKKGLNT